MTIHTCPECGARVARVYQFGLCRECIVRELAELRPLINHYRDHNNFERGAA